MQLGTHYGGIGLGLISGVGLVIFVFVFVFGLVPGEPPISVMLTILAVIGCASVLQSASDLDVMMQLAEKILRRHPKYITILAPLTTWSLTLLCGTGHVVYTMFPILMISIPASLSGVLLAALWSMRRGRRPRCRRPPRGRR